MIKIDFHTHSTSSDGLMSPKEVVERAYQNGVKYLALTDHDTVFHPKYSPIITELLTVTFSQFQKASLESSLEL